MAAAVAEEPRAVGFPCPDISVGLIKSASSDLNPGLLLLSGPDIQMTPLDNLSLAFTFTCDAQMSGTQIRRNISRQNTVAKSKHLH